jgi:Tripartite tricarboxylate transporter TctB family
MDTGKSPKDLLAGLVFVAFGLAFGYASLNYELGSATRMGPGFFPLVLAGILTVLGAVIVFEGVTTPSAGRMGPTPWFGGALLVAALVVFGLTVRGLGLVPALMIAVFMSAFASRRTGIVGAAVMTVGLTALCVLIFIYGLGLPLRMFGPWLGF